MDIRVISTLNQLFTRGTYTQINNSKNKKIKNKIK